MTLLRTNEVVVRSEKARLRETSARSWTLCRAASDSLLASMYRRHIAFTSKIDTKKIATSIAATTTSTRVKPSSSSLDRFTCVFMCLINMVMASTVYRNLYGNYSSYCTHGSRKAYSTPRSEGPDNNRFPTG